MKQPKRQTIAAKLREMRSAAGLTQEALAEKLVVPLRTYHGWERGEAEPRAGVWERIKAITGSDMA